VFWERSASESLRVATNRIELRAFGFGDAFASVASPATFFSAAALIAGCGKAGGVFVTRFDRLALLLFGGENAVA
jgi:hypothetical protein